MLPAAFAPVAAVLAYDRCSARLVPPHPTPGARVVKIARTFLHTPYALGRREPLDRRRLLRPRGRGLPQARRRAARTSRTSSGTRCYRVKKLRKGDIVAFGSGGSSGHVGIYIGARPVHPRRRPRQGRPDRLPARQARPPRLPRRRPAEAAATALPARRATPSSMRAPSSSVVSGFMTVMRSTGWSSSRGEGDPPLAGGVVRRAQTRVQVVVADVAEAEDVALRLVQGSNDGCSHDPLPDGARGRAEVVVHARRTPRCRSAARRSRPSARRRGASTGTSARPGRRAAPRGRGTGTARSARRPRRGRPRRPSAARSPPAASASSCADPTPASARARRRPCGGGGWATAAPRRRARRRRAARCRALAQICADRVEVVERADRRRSGRRDDRHDGPPSRSRAAARGPPGRSRGARRTAPARRCSRRCRAGRRRGRRSSARARSRTRRPRRRARPRSHASRQRLRAGRGEPAERGLGGADRERAAGVGAAAAPGRPASARRGVRRRSWRATARPRRATG